ncbi:MAG: 3'-5' exonuclease [Spirochaetaceae bacterium]|jgi:DNA polymerase-3 subunit epsilon|nr:3'-5' exonuclease [Spirochaetaceae bacterium]
MNTTVVFFDTETNGLNAECSVLSISAIKAAIDNKSAGSAIHNPAVERYERFYFRAPGEPFGAGAVRVNGLTDAVIAEKRGDAAYPRHFREDTEAFRAFCGIARHFVAHNIAFDRQYIPFSLPNTFCTMTENKKVLKLRRKTGEIKFPSLKETALFYGIAPDSAKLHTSAYDTDLVYAIFIKMLESPKTRKKARKFLENLPQQADLSF